MPARPPKSSAASSLSGGSRKRIRAHANPLSESDISAPRNPSEVDWSLHFPKYFPPKSPEEAKEVTIADIGCGFAGLLVGLGPTFPDKLIIGLEIRDKVVDIDKERIRQLRVDCWSDIPSVGRVQHDYQNISVDRTNIMKYAPNYFRKGQLEKIFFLFPDPHFKRSNYRRRVINYNFLSMYAYILREGGILYTISDVKDLHEWMVFHLDEHPLFERIPNEECLNDPCYNLIHNATEEGQKVTRLHGTKYPAIYRRIAAGVKTPLKPPSHARSMPLPPTTATDLHGPHVNQADSNMANASNNAAEALH